MEMRPRLHGTRCGERKKWMLLPLKCYTLALFCLSEVYCQWHVNRPDNVKGVPGSCVYIPCTYTYPSNINTEKGIDEIWYKGFLKERKVVYHSKEPSDEEFRQRVEFLGLPFPKNCTVLLKNLTKADEGSYNFRYEIIDADKWADNKGVRLDMTDVPLLPEVVFPSAISEGASVTFQCSTPYFCPDGSAALNWKGFTPERSFLSSDVRLDTNAVLMMQNLTTSFSWMENGKKIMCAVSVGDQKPAEKEVIINVLYPPKSVRVQIRPSGKNIKQGDTVTVTCHVNSSNPAVSSYVWFKDGKKFSEEPILAFHSIAKSDHGEYWCDARNLAGNTASDTARLIIFSAVTVVTPSQEVREGELVTLTCEVLGVKPDEVHYSWYKNNIWIKEGSVRSMIFHEVASSDSGYYYCKVQNDLGSDSSPPITLNVLYPPRPPTLSSFLETRQGNLAILICTVDSNPFSQLALYKDGTLIASTTSHGAPNQRIQITSLKNSLSLEIRDVVLSDEGTYACEAKNSIGNSTASVPFTVEMVRVLVEPSTEIEEGQKVRLTCAATRSSEEGTAYTWFKNDEWLKEDTESNVLTIQSVSPQDAGFYYCKARTRRGSHSSRPVTLQVSYPPRGLSLTSLLTSRDPLKASILCMVHSAPPAQLSLYRGESLIVPSLNPPDRNRYSAAVSRNSLQLEIQDVVLEDEGDYKCFANNTYGETAGMLHFTAPTAIVAVTPSEDVQEGEGVNLTCALKSSSHAGDQTFSWYKDRILLVEERHMVLQFASISSSDSGSYFCKVMTNESSKASAPIHLQVAYAPRGLQLRSFQDTGGGRSAFIRCTVDSYPAATMELYRGEELVTSGLNKDPSNTRYSVTSLHNELTLRINNVKSEDEGRYNCTARNPITATSEALQFTKQTARVLVSPSSDILEGDRVTLTCDVIKSQLDGMEYVWYKNSGWLEKTTTNALIFDNVRSSDSGYYHCLARDTQDSSTSPSVALHVAYTPRKPVLSSFWEASGAQVGIIRCSVDSDPQSTLSFYFKDELVGSSHSPASSSPRMKIISTQNMLRLEIHQVMLEDEGSYTCVAKNSIGESRSVANFTAQTTQILVSPSWSVQEGQAVNLTCMVASEELGAARYSWYKNGKEFLSTMSNILQFPNITSEDKGSYSCSIQSLQGSKHSQPVSLDVLYPPRNVHLKSFLDSEGGKVGIILCSVESNPLPEMYLYKDGQLLFSSPQGSRSNKRLHAYFFPDGIRVEIRDVKTEDQGVYSFMAKNAYGTAQSSVTFAVTGVRVLVSPAAEVREGSSIMLICHVPDGSETVRSFTWYKNSRWLQEGTLASLEFGNVSSSDTGSYSCTAHGTGDPKSSPPVSITVLYPPRKHLLTSFMELQERQLAVIFCQVDSEPPSHIVLLRGDELMMADGYQESTHSVRLFSSRNTLRLEIQDISEDDRDEYTCQANNSIGWSQKSIHFTVQTARLEVSPSTKIQEGHTLTLTCQAPRTDNVTYIWYRNNKWLHKSFQKSLALHRVSSADTGSYHCMAEHKKGTSASPLVGINVLYAPRTLILTSYLETHGRRQALISCRVDSDPPSIITLSRDGTKLSSSVVTPADRGDKYWSTTSHNYLRLEIRDVVAEDSGSYACSANNTLGIARSSIVLDTKERGDSAYKAISWVAIVCVMLIAGGAGYFFWKQSRHKTLLTTDEDSIEMSDKDTEQATETAHGNL